MRPTAVVVLDALGEDSPGVLRVVDQLPVGVLGPYRLRTVITSARPCGQLSLAHPLQLFDD